MQPLAERLRPKTLDEYIGQKHLVGPGAILRKMIDAGRISSVKKFRFAEFPAVLYSEQSVLFPF